MDATKWKSVAVKVEDHMLLKAVSKHNYRGPAAQITKMLDEEIKKLAVTNGIDQESFRKDFGQFRKNLIDDFNAQG